MKAFAAHIENLLEPKHRLPLFAAVRETLLGQRQELRYRQQRCTSMRRYRKIRRLSIGIMPFFVVLERQLSGTRDESSAALGRLKHLVVSVIILQNDLVGLAKDIKEGESMNSLLVMARPKRNDAGDLDMYRKLTSAAKIAEREHNLTVCQAIATAQSIFESARSSNESRLAGMILSFSHHHLKWAMHTRRYVAN
jgi:hypothetical protein